jgi:phosphomannomutase/phosphoglucomutase
VTSGLVNPNIFRAYDIRGTVGEDLTAPVVSNIARAFGSWVRHRTGARVAIGRDNRASSETFHGAAIDGLRAAGCDVWDLGLCTTPAMNFTVIDQSLDGGINITGSHNPIEYNGVKFAGHKGYTFTEEDIQEIRRLVESEDYMSGPGTVAQKDPKPAYFERLRSIGQPKRPMRVVIDCGNGVVGDYAPQLLRDLGHEVIDLYCELDGTFPHHLPDPEVEANVADLKVAVRDNNAEFGVAFDGDGDRLGIVSERGDHYSADYIIILLARDLLTRTPRASVLVDVKCSENVLEEIRKSGGTPVLGRTGYTFIRRQMRDDGILLAGEESGHIFFGEGYPQLDDGILAACKVLQVLSGSDRSLSQQFSRLTKRYATHLIQVPCSDETKFQVVDRARETLAARPDVRDVATIDGIRAWFEDGWALVRASNTTPSLTLRFEAMTPARLDELQGIVWETLNSVPGARLEDWRKAH